MQTLVIALAAIGIAVLGGTKATIALSGYVPPRTIFHADGGYTSNENITVTRAEDPDAGVTLVTVEDF